MIPYKLYSSGLATSSVNLKKYGTWLFSRTVTRANKLLIGLLYLIKQVTYKEEVVSSGYSTPRVSWLGSASLLAWSLVKTGSPRGHTSVWRRWSLGLWPRSPARIAGSRGHTVEEIYFKITVKTEQENWQIYYKIFEKKIGSLIVFPKHSRQYLRI